MEEIQKVYVGIDEISKMYALPKSWFYSRTRTKAIPFIKAGKYVKFDPVITLQRNLR